MELKARFTNENMELSDKSWNEGTILKPEDPIISKNLCHDRCIVIAKIDMSEIKHRSIYLFLHNFLFSSDCFKRM